MKIVTMDWTDIYNQLELKDDKKRVYKLEDFMTNTIEEFWDKLYQVLASIEPIKIEDQYSPLATLKHIPDVIVTPYGEMSKSNFRSLFNILYNVPRSKILPGTASEHPQWSQLVPLWLAAYKHYKNIGYNSWIRDDSIKYFLSSSDLWEEISSIPEKFVFDTSKLAEYRHEALTTKVRTFPISSPVQKKCDIGYQIRKNSKVGAMYLQIWLANRSIRHPDMILDPVDWECIPEPYDAEMLEINTKKKKVIDELPF